MITSVSWQQYVALVSMLLIPYYLYIGLRYYRPEWKQIIARRFKKDVVSPGNDALPGFFSSPPDDLYAVASQLTLVAQQIIEQAGRRKLAREELILALQLLLAKTEYHVLRAAPYNVAITNFITKACEQYCSIQLNEGEMRVLWNR